MLYMGTCLMIGAAIELLSSPSKRSSSAVALCIGAVVSCGATVLGIVWGGSIALFVLIYWLTVRKETIGSLLSMAMGGRGGMGAMLPMLAQEMMGQMGMRGQHFPMGMNPFMRGSRRFGGMGGGYNPMAGSQWAANRYGGPGAGGSFRGNYGAGGPPPVGANAYRGRPMDAATIAPFGRQLGSLGIGSNAQAGVMAGLMGESGVSLDPTAFNTKDPGGGSGGIGQWNRGRLIGPS